MLELINVCASYHQAPVVQGVSMRIETAETVALIGPNGAGKSTLLGALSGTVPRRSGQAMLDGVDLMALPSHAIVALGVVQVPEGRHVFAPMTVQDNLLLGSVALAQRSRFLQQRFDAVYALFPRLAQRRQQLAGTLSGGEQQMVALARALSRRPSLLLADELSLGLAPKIVDRLLGAVRTSVDATGSGALIVEQHASKALQYADRVYLLARGQIALHLTADEALKRLDEIEQMYLQGTSETEEDHIERKRRKDKRKQWKRLRVRDRSMTRLTGLVTSTRKADDDDYYFEKEQVRRDRAQRARK